jgi:hypothetical protein
MSCRRLCLPLAMTRTVMPAYWTSCEFSPKRLRKAARSTYLYVDRTILDLFALTYHTLNRPVWWNECFDQNLIRA